MKSNAEWRFWGKADPLYAVATHPGKDRKSRTPWTDEEFLALGASDFREIASHWKHFGMGHDRCVEIGCGSGRMTKQLLAHFDTVLAIDVSPDQIATATQLLGADVERVTFVVVDQPDIPAAEGELDGLFTTHVFQHLASYEAVERYLELAFARLRSGSSICFHIPVPGAHRGVEHPVWWYWLRTAKVLAKRLIGSLRIMEYRRYDASRVFRTLERIGFVDCELRIFTLTSSNDPHSFFFARRP